MGAFASHVIFAKEAFYEIEDNMLEAVIQRNKEAFYLGAQGPDLFLYNVLMLAAPKEKNLGNRMHKERTGRFFEYFLWYLWQLEDVTAMEEGVSYFLGFLSHYAWDTRLHPFVYARIGYDPFVPYSAKATLGMHLRMEAIIDAKLLVKKRHILPSSYCPKKDMKISKQTLSTIAELLAKAAGKTYCLKVSTQNVTASYQLMHTIVPYFYHRETAFRKWVEKAERVIREDGMLSNFFVYDRLRYKKKVMNTEKREWHHPWNRQKVFRESVWDLYRQGMQDYKVYVSEVMPILKEMMGERFIKSEEFIQKGEKSIKRRYRIKKAVQEFGNLSYDSGLH